MVCASLASMAATLAEYHGHVLMDVPRSVREANHWMVELALQPGALVRRDDGKYARPDRGSQAMTIGWNRRNGHAVVMVDGSRWSIPANWLIVISHVSSA